MKRETPVRDTTEADADIRLSCTAAEVRVVLAGTGTVAVSVDGGKPEQVAVSGTPNSCQLRDAEAGTGTIEITVSPGVQVYSFTFG